MKVIRFNSIKNYKSFGDFSWTKFCKRQDKQGNCVVPQMTKFSVFFGENGSGKSSLCDILKNLSVHKDFQTSPESAEVAVEDNGVEDVLSFASGKWDKSLPSTSTLFFDIDFINSNVHTNGVRSNNLQSGAHTQNSGKLIIDLDQNANELNSAVTKAKEEIDTFDKTNCSLLELKPTEKEAKLFDEYVKDQKIDIEALLSELGIKKDKLVKEIATLEKLQKKSSEIQKIQIPSTLAIRFSLSDLKTYKELFERIIEKNVNIEVDQKIKNHFEKHALFIEEAKNHIPDNYLESECPICMQPLKNAKSVIEYYRAVFDKTFETNKKKYLEDISDKLAELNGIKTFVESLERDVIRVFSTYESIKNDYELEDVYKIEDKSRVLGLIESIDSKSVANLLGSLDGLKQIDKKPTDPTEDHVRIVKLIEWINTIISELNKIIQEKNKLVEALKTKYLDLSKIQIDLAEAKKQLSDCEERIEFLAKDKLTQLIKLKDLVAKRQILVEAKKTCEKERDDYITLKVPENIINKMIAVLDKFNLNFTVEPFRSSASTRDYAFAFKIKDKQGKEREIKDGLSEGERQLISLSFFFAINDNVSDKSLKILVFDDPITSLDAPNLKILAELIHAQISQYSQVIVFTHHPLFHKYLVKPDIPDKAKFGVLKNSELFGGSFIFSDPSYDMIDEVKLCNQEIATKATSGTLKLEEISLKYGQLLRLAVEKFIKHELLMWNKEGDFGSQIVCNLKSSKSKISKLTEGDLDTLTNIYNYCNQSNLLHVDKENPSALTELLSNINRFVTILDKSKN